MANRHVKPAVPAGPPPKVEGFYVTVRHSDENGDPGQIAIGWYFVQDGMLTMCDENGKPLEGLKPELLPDGVKSRSYCCQASAAATGGYRGCQRLELIQIISNLTSQQRGDLLLAEHQQMRAMRRAARDTIEFQGRPFLSNR
jgi:hypothetical protein